MSRAAPSTPEEEVNEALKHFSPLELREDLPSCLKLIREMCEPGLPPEEYEVCEKWILRARAYLNQILRNMAAASYTINAKDGPFGPMWARLAVLGSWISFWRSLVHSLAARKTFSAVVERLVALSRQERTCWVVSGPPLLPPNLSIRWALPGRSTLT